MGTDEPPDYICPFCGHHPAKKYYLIDRLKKLGVNGSGEGASGGFDVELNPNPRNKFYYDCTGCEMKYEDISDIDIGSVLLDMRVRPLVVDQVIETYGIELKMLISNPAYRTGIVRRTRFFNSFLNLIRSKRKIVVCILNNNQRRFVSLIKKKNKKHKTEYYEAVSLGRP